MVEREYAAHRETYAPVDELANKWGGTLASRGASTPADQVAHIDRVLSAEHTLMNGTDQQKNEILRQLHQVAFGGGAPSGGPAPQAHQVQPQMQPPPQPQPTGDPLTDQLQRTHTEQQTAAWQQAMATAGPQGEQAQKIHQAQQHIMEVASAKNQDGSPAFPYFGEVGREIYAVIQHQMQNGQQPDLVSAYHHAVSIRPDLVQRHMAGQLQELRAFRERNPVAFDPVFAKRAKSIAAGHIRTGTPTNSETIFAETLRREPDIAARYGKQVAAAKQGGHAIQPTLDQQLEAMWQAGVGQ